MASGTYRKRLEEKGKWAVEHLRRREEGRGLSDDLSEAERRLLTVEARASFLAGALMEEFAEAAELLRFIIE